MRTASVCVCARGSVQFRQALRWSSHVQVRYADVVQTSHRLKSHPNDVIPFPDSHCGQVDIAERHSAIDEDGKRRTDPLINAVKQIQDFCKDGRGRKRRQHLLSRSYKTPLSERRSYQCNASSAACAADA